MVVQPQWAHIENVTSHTVKDVIINILPISAKHHTVAKCKTHFCQII